ncbi:nuclear transport factor 2 family protein [Luteimonas sp. M1R5S18]|uniref:Nuclear transport factor 2 family protein n=1 Tax=Luteimonas rhizosphaericola TaxID=3042024 RepID=A0ABT6JF45_9GAMM|nr:nuclear transport factor 2 family protein [Luteimonas rhizosphaericola]MDH5829080.1 nuclear transport factor 2 family protein [Luteimonas rhizosphaericola]
MDNTKALWQLEEQFWLGSSDFYSATLAPDALMVLPPPAGILDRAATIKSVSSGNRWGNVLFRDKQLVSAGPAAAVLVYVASADRGTPDSAYVAQCTSTYVCEGEQWLLVVHHQAPIVQAAGGHA